MKIEDIAKIANVSKAAVSLALNGKPGVSTETRDRILRIAQDTGYIQRTQIHAQQIYRNNRYLRFAALTHSGIIQAEYEKQPFFNELIRHIEDKCSSLGYSLLFTTLSSEHLENEIHDLASDIETSGLILLGTNLSKEQISLFTGRINNLVIIDSCYESIAADFVVMNNYMGGYQAASHLIQLGHRNIGYAQSRNRMYNFDARRSGFLAALNDHQLTLSDEHTFVLSPTVVAPQQDFLDDWKKLKEKPTALFCDCDYIAISVIKSTYELGLRLPEDLSIVGFDDIPEAEVVTPELTTIHVEKELIASIAVERIVRVCEGEISETKVKTLVDTKLVERRSTAAIK